MKKNILIIAYKFPPMGGIGTRRWAKFSKYLTKFGYQVHVLTADYKFQDKVTWKHDIDRNIKIYKFKSKYPLWLLTETNNAFMKQFKRYSNFILKKFLFYIDIAQYDAKNILGEAKKIINKYDIKNVIASGHPVSINYISSYLKIDNPDINLIQDYRDNWNDLNVYQYGSNEGLCFFKRKEKSVYQEFLTLFYADKVINVSDDLTRMLEKKHKSLGNKFMTLTNGYDIDDYKEVECESNSFNMIYTGSLFNERIQAIYLLLDAIIAIDDEYITKNLQIVVYSNYGVHRIDKKYQTLIDKNIFFRDPIPPKDVMNKIAKFSFCLSINSRFAPYAFGTKIFDYMALNKKIVHISNGGALYDLLKDNGELVSNYDIENVKTVLLKIKDVYLQGASNSSQSQKYSGFSLENLTLKLEKVFV